MIRALLHAAVFAALALASFPAQAQLVGDDTALGSSCAGFAAGATRMTADPDQDGAQVVLICDGTTWNAMEAGASALDDLSDVTLTGPASGHVLQYNGSVWANVAASTAMGTTTMVPNWPDAIQCYAASFSPPLTAIFTFMGSDSGGYRYRFPDAATPYEIIFNSSGAYSSNSGSTAFDCVSSAKSISTLYSEGKAFHFIGSSLASAAAPSGGVQFNNGSGVLAADSALVWDNTNKRLGIGTASPGYKLTVSANAGALPAGLTGTVAQLGNADGTATRVLLDSFANAPSIDLRRAGTTAASPSAVQTGDNLGQLVWLGYGATGYSSAARAYIRTFAAENWTDSAQSAVITFGTVPAGSTTIAERVRIDSSGNVGIGETNPQDKLHVAGQVRIDNDTDATNKGCLRFNGASNKLEYSHNCAAWSELGASVAETDPQVGAVTNTKWCRGDGTAVQCDQNAPSGGDNLGNHTATAGLNMAGYPISDVHVFQQRDQNGNDGKWSALTNWDNALYFQRHSTAGAWEANIAWIDLNSGSLTVTGDIQFSGFLRDVSDIRLKEDIRPVRNALQRISALDPISYRMKSDPEHRTEFGFSAQDLRKVFPEMVAVGHDTDRTLSINYLGLIAPMVEAIKELKAESDQLDAENKELKATNKALLRRIEAIERELATQH